MSGYSFTVEGMTCAACVGRVERVLSAVEGAGQARVNLATGRAEVEGGDAAELAGALTRAGYPARQDHLRLSVAGMDCASCIGRVEAALMALPGVTEARVNLATAEADVRFLADSVTPERMISAISDLGYIANLQEQSAPRPDASLQLRRDFWLSAALALPVFLSEMGGHLFPAFHHWLHGLIGQQGLWGLQFLLIAAPNGGNRRAWEHPPRSPRNPPVGTNDS